MAKYRARFNDKARAGGVAKRNALKAKRQKQFEKSGATTEEAKEAAEKAARIHEMARPESDARKRVRMAMQFPEKANAAKKKRLEKYIDRQVKKDEKEELLRKLSKTQSKVDSSNLQSLGKLGQKRKKREEWSNDEDVSDGEDFDSDEIDVESKSSDSDSDFAESEHKPVITSFNQLQSESESESESVSGSESEPQTGHDQPSVFIDHRLQAGTGFGFANLPKKNKTKKTSWKERLGFSAADELLQKVESEVEDESQSDSEEEESEEESEASESESNAENELTSGQEFSKWVKEADPNSYVFTPTPVPQNYTHAHRKLDSEMELVALDALKNKPGYFERLELEPVVVNRTEEIESVRLKLPAVASEQQVMDAVNHFDTVVITGATGSGKTTQIPQFLFENGYASYGMIGVTQPRRVAAVSMAQRINKELCGACSVGHQIRFDAKVNNDTKIKLMTDGVLLKEMSSDLLLSRYSAIIVDEAHERGVNTDILIGMLSRVIKLRRKNFEEQKDQLKPLKLIIMSATLRVADFAENERLFSTPPPVVNVEARQFPVTNHFSRRTATDYVEDAVKKVRRIHEKLPKGGILVFLTGKSDIQRAMNELKPNTNPKVSMSIHPKHITFEEEAAEIGIESEFESDGEDVNDESDVEIDDEDKDEEHNQKELHVLPLHSLLSTEDQLKVFQPVPKNHRLCVIATNVAETSLTIPGIRYVIDCGRAKMRLYERTGVQKYAIKWVSKASADQRAGRAGRTGPGHCYRLYSSAMFEKAFNEFGEPEIQRMPAEGLTLQMKAMGISNIVNFPFPTPVPEHLLKDGIRVLQSLDALDVNENITDFGLKMSIFPLHPRQSKMLLIGNQNECLPYVTALVAAMSVQDVILPSQPKKKGEEGEEISSPPVLDNQADVLQLLSAYAAYSWTPTQVLCQQLRLRHKAMVEIASLVKQVAKVVAFTLSFESPQTMQNYLNKPLKVPNSLQISTLKQIVAAVYLDHVAARQALIDPSSVEKTSKQVSRQAYVTVSNGPAVYIHPDTIMQVAPDYVVYSMLTTSDQTDKIRLRPLTSVTPQQLSVFGSKTPLVTYSKPLGGAYAPKMLSSTKREAWVVPRFGALLGSQGWDLPPKKVIQERVKGVWVNI